jgi:isoleucyl-tRNA synthetase
VLQDLIANGKLDPLTLEQAVLEHWREEDIVERVAVQRTDGERWVTYEGPPTANGSPALHHVWTSVYKDVYARFHMMRGQRVERRGGWDCQGLPVEIAVERALGIHDKREVESYGAERFVEQCREFVEGNIEKFEATLQRVAFWVDYEHAYRTMDDSYVESVWWHLKELWKKQLVFEATRVVPYCIRCGTSLSSHELGQPEVYRDREDLAAFVAFPLVEDDREIVIWTTTPWTLVANSGVAIDPNATYGVYHVDHRKLIVAVDRAASLFEGVSPAETIDGQSLVGRTYQTPYPELGVETGKIVPWDEVEMETGSGAVHIAPAFGEADAGVGERTGLPTINPMNAEGCFTDGQFSGQSVFDAVQPVLADLKARGLLIREDRHLHSYPHCWRCRTALVYWGRANWFIRTSQEAEKFVAENETITWYPESIKNGRFGNWLRNNVDWTITRDRYWGTPLPLWRCPNGHVTCAGSRAELSDLAREDLSHIQLHRPWIDGVTFACPDCGETAEREPSVCDVWLDSGCMPAAQLHHPHDPEALETRYPADFICEAIDQTRGWFYSLLAVNTMVFGSTPYRNAVCLGLLVDDTGRKMSKSVGNVINPDELLEQHGADAVRWYLLSSGAPWSSRRISVGALQQRQHRDLGTLWNVLCFYKQYAELEGFTPSSHPSTSTGHVLDCWVRSRLSQLVEEATRGLEGYSAHEVANQISDFIDDLSNWYVRRGRRRFWGTEGTDSDAFETLHHVLSQLARLIAPFCPFFAEAMHRALDPTREHDSIHLTDWPTAEVRDVELERAMDDGKKLAALARTVRTSEGIPVRQPLRQAMVVGVASLPAEVLELVAEETNVEELLQRDASSAPVRHLIQPNWKRLGPRLGKNVQALKSAMAELPEEVVDNLRAGRNTKVQVGKEAIVLEPEDVVFSEELLTGWAAASDGPITVALDTTLDERLLAEFRCRQTIRDIQIARRESGLEVSDRVRLWLGADVWEQRSRIAKEVLAADVQPLADAPDAGAEGVSGGENFAFAA